MTQVLIAAPTLTLRAGLRALLAPTELQVVGETAMLAGPINLSSVDVILLADEELLADAARIINDERAVALVVLSDDDRAVAELRELPLRGWGIVPQDAGTAELESTIQAAAQGAVVLPLQVAHRLIKARPIDTVLTDVPADALTGREHEVLQLVSQGLSNKLIARELSISEHTVKFHVSSIYAKLGAANRTEAVNRGARLGLITL
jgi:DNA-binding NarL/FixJ family response regulator